MINLDDITFGTVLVSPDRKRFAMVDAGIDDAGAHFAWLVPVDAHNVRTGKRRVRLYFGETGGWMTLRHALSNPARYIAYLFSQGSDRPAESIFDAPDDSAARSRILTLVTRYGADGHDLHRVRPQSAIAAETAARKSTVHLTVRVL